MAQFCKDCIKKYIGNKKNKNYDEWLVKDYGLCEGCGYEYLNKIIAQAKFQARQELFREVILRISRRQCIICEKNLDLDLGRDWHIPLCKIHRLSYLDKQAKKILGEKNEM